jgi:hypothetical protein
VVFLEVWIIGDAVDDCEKAGRVQRGQHAVPCATVQIDALRAVGEEGAGFIGGAGGSDDEEGVFGHRDEGLAAKGVTFDQSEGVGQAAGFGLEDRDAGAGASRFTAEIWCGAVVVAAAVAIIDQAEIASGVKDVAEGGEGLGSEEFGLDGVCHAICSALGRHPGVFHPRTPAEYFCEKEITQGDQTRRGRAGVRGG